MEGPALGPVPAGQNRDIPALIAKLAGKFFHDRGLAGAANGQITDGNDLHPKRGITQNAIFVKEPPNFDCDPENIRTSIEKSAG